MAGTESFDLDDERRINLTQNTRERIVSAMLVDGKIPEDKEDRQFLMEALNGLDRTTLGKARIKTDSQANKNSQETAGLVAQLLAKVSPMAIQNNQPQIQRQAPALDGDFTLVTVDGETEITSEELTYDTFMAKMQ